MNDPKKKNISQQKKRSQEKDDEVKIKYDVYTPEDLEPRPKAYGEIEY